MSRSVTAPREASSRPPKECSGPSQRDTGLDLTSGTKPEREARVTPTPCSVSTSALSTAVSPVPRTSTRSAGSTQASDGASG